MGKHQKNWARMARARLTAELGGRCVMCGATTSLEFDCREPQGHRHHKLDTSARMSFYHAQHAKGNLQLLCSACNVFKGSRPATPQHTGTDLSTTELPY